MKPRKHTNKVTLVTLSKVVSTSGLGLFLTVGLSGCDGTPDECKDLSILPQSKLEECKRHHSTTFIPMSSTTSSSRSSGYFSSGSESVRTTSSHISSGG